MINLNELKTKLDGIIVPGIPITGMALTVLPEKIEKRKVGRPIAVTPEVRTKIEEVAALDGTVEEMASYAGIGRQTLYDYIKENPVFSDRIQALRERPVLKARNTVMKAIEEPQHAEWYLERKKRNEFSPRVEVDAVVRTIRIDL